MSSAYPAFARTGGPQRINCDLSAYVYKEDIQKMMDINDLLNASTVSVLSQGTQDCHTYNGEVVTCENTLTAQNIELSYAFNSQNGNMELTDSLTGQSTYATWLNEYDETKSGYLTLDISLTNLRGGLAGNPRIFEIDARCWAGKDDWK
jgi:hypothetical protein